MKIQIQWEFDLPSDSHPDAHDQFAEEQGIPLIVDMCDYLKDPESASDYQITDALSDEHGWLIQGWEVIESCNSDQSDIIINHKDQSINLKDINMETNNISTPNTNEDSMITQLFQQFIENGGTPKVTEFKKHLNNLINSDIKQLCSRSGKSADGDDWRSQLKSRFSGRGAKWVKVPTESVIPTLDKFDTEGFNTETYRSHIEKASFAFIRFAGPRISADGKQAAAFEVRTDGSTIDHPKQLHFITVNLLDELVQPLNGTPHSLKLEVIAKPEEASEEVKETEVTETEVTETAVAKTEVDLDETDVPDPATLNEVFEDFIEDANDDMFV